MMKHSPGPWYRHGQKDDPCGSAIIRASNGFELANSRGFLIEEYEANANLIAAAPGMLETLEAIAGNHDAGPGIDAAELCELMTRRAMEVLQKIRGE